MGWLDRDGKIAGKIHWFDLLLFVVALVVIIRVLSVSWPGTGNKKTGIIRMSVLVQNLPPDQVENIQVGQWVKDRRTGNFLGKIISKEVKPAVKYEWDDGNLYVLRSPVNKDLFLLIERQGEIREKEGIFAGREPVRSGQQRVFHTLYSEFSGVIQNLSVQDTGDNVTK